MFGPILNDEPTSPTFNAKAPDPKAQPGGQETAKPRARLGPQRYLMFDALSESGGMGLIALAADTRLNPKRIKDQMMSDLRLGMVTSDDNHYRLTPAGLDLLNRFQAYKKAHNQPLPSRDDPSSAGDQDESETDDMMEGAMTE